MAVVTVAARTYTIHVCPNCGGNPQITPNVPGCGPRMIAQGRNLWTCLECGHRGTWKAIEVAPAEADRGA